MQRDSQQEAAKGGSGMLGRVSSRSGNGDQTNGGDVASGNAKSETGLAGEWHVGLAQGVVPRRPPDIPLGLPWVDRRISLDPERDRCVPIAPGPAINNFVRANFA